MYKESLKTLAYRFQNACRWHSLANGIYVFNYHRIGDADSSLFDPNIYSCTAERFETHLKFYKKHFSIINMQQMVEMATNNSPLDKRYAMLTFDDGYIDNYEQAFPLLKRYDVPAVFYITPDSVDNPKLPWWDEVAWLIKHTPKKRLVFSQWDLQLDFSSLDKKTAIRELLSAIKMDAANTIEKKMAWVRETIGLNLPDDLSKQRLFLSWDEAKEMYQSGMDIGSHGVSHKILSHLNDEDQRFEMLESKRIIESKLGAKIHSIAYPVGNVQAFNATTIRVAKQVGYEIGFSFIRGVIGSLDDSWRYQLRRLSVDSNCSIPALKRQVLASQLVR